MQNKHLAFGQHYLNAQYIPNQTTVVKQPINHIWLIDRSGSMYSELKKLIANLKQLHRTLDSNDTLSIGWFSSQGMYRFPIKGFRLTSDQDHQKLDTELDQYSQSLNLTCFSEILQDTLTVIEELSFVSDRFSLWLFTDGYPVVNNQSKEEAAIEVAMTQLSHKLCNAQLVGYGEYYNKQLMSLMALWVGAELRHASDESSYSAAMSDFIESSTGTPKIKVQLLDRLPLYVFTDDTVSCPVLAEDEDGNGNGNGALIPEALVNPGNDYVYYISNKPIPNSVEVVITEDNYKTETIIKGALAGAVVLNQALRTDLAIELLSVIGETHFLNRFSNAFTPTEHGEAEADLQNHLKLGLDYIEPFNKSYIPKPDETCVIDIINELLEKDAKLAVVHQEFKYKSSGRKSTSKEGYPKFNSYYTLADLADITWHSSKLNLSLLAKISGYIELPEEEAKRHGLPRFYSTFVWRNYTLVKDGNLWTTQLPVSYSNDMQSVEVLNLNKYPLINKVIAEAAAVPGTAQRLADMIVEDTVLGAYIKTYKNYLDKSYSIYADDLTAEQKEYLASVGVSDNGFCPPSDPVEATDYYMAKTFDLKIAGWSSLPKVKEVEAKMEGGTHKWKETEKVMASAISLMRLSTQNCDKNVVNGWLNSQIKALKKRQQKLRSEIQSIKLSVLLGHRWFPEFSSRQDCSLQGSYSAQFLSGIDVETSMKAIVKFQLGEVKVTI